MKYLITGGCGFIGSYLAEALLDKGEVCVIDDLSTGSIHNIAHLKKRDGFKYIIDTIMNQGLMAELVDEADIVFHMAAAVGVRYVLESPIRAMAINIRGTEVVLNLASKKGKKVVIASSSEVYGKGSDMPFCENGDLVFGMPNNGRWSYACSKAMDEFMSIAFYKEYQLPVVVARLFNVVGLRQTGRYGMVLPTFIKQALSGFPITVYGDGHQTRCFAWVGDVVEALCTLSEHQEAVGEIFNVGSDIEISINGLAQTIKDITQSCSSIVHIPYGEAYKEGFEDMMHRRPDLSKLRSLIGYKPTKNIREIITLMCLEDTGN